MGVVNGAEVWVQKSAPTTPEAAVVAAAVPGSAENCLR